ncbi:hypothetical protein HYW53_01120 [Candidatus Giovannonibacteria bacterium]|nr:hypothetical protein [Candidatus Giovannonibacteria bacterium]
MKKISILLLLAFFFSGCHWATIGAASGGAIGYSVARGPGAAAGAGIGIIGGAIADVLDRRPHERHAEVYRYGLSCERYHSEVERQECLAGAAEAERQNRQDALYRARRTGYDLHRDRYYGYW